MDFLRPFTAAYALSLLLGCSTPAPPPAPQANLDTLLERLRATPNDREAEMIEGVIRHAWRVSGETRVDTLVARGIDEMRRGDYDTALRAFDQVVTLAPAFAEGWNLRAHVHIMRDEYAEAFFDIERTLRIEPRHFGALVGLGQLFLLVEQDKAALHAFEAALAINPHLSEARDQARELHLKLDGQPV